VLYLRLLFPWTVGLAAVTEINYT